MARLENWTDDIYDYLKVMQSAEFEWGKCDCLIFVSDALKLICDVDPMSKKKKKDPKTIRGKYTTKEKAYELIKRHRKTMPAIMDAHFDRKPVNFAQRGDIVMAKVNGSRSFGVVWNRGKAFFKAEGKGLVEIKVKECTHAWLTY